MRGLNSVESVDVSIGFPPFEIGGTFKPSQAERLAAWELLVELASRTSVAPLRADHGLIREALSSLYSIYGTTRELLRKHGPEVARRRIDGNLSLGIIAMRVLNDILRPTLSEWHPKLEDHEATKPADVGRSDWEKLWPQAAACRIELNRVRQAVRAYIDTLGQIAGTPDLADTVLPLPAALAAPRVKVVARSFSAGFKPRRQMVRWLSVIQGALIALVMAIDRFVRRSRGASASVAQPPTVDYSSKANGAGELWFDYVADLGEGFDGTTAVAWQLGRESVVLSGDGHDEFPSIPAGGLPRGPVPRDGWRRGLSLCVSPALPAPVGCSVCSGLGWGPKA